MLGTLVVGTVFFSIIAWALKQSHDTLKSGRCAGCACKCSIEQMAECKISGK